MTQSRPIKNLWTPQRCVLLHACVCLSILCLSVFLEDHALRIAIGGSLMMVTLFFIGMVESTRYPVWLTPISFYCFWYTIVLGPSSILLSRYQDIEFFRFILQPSDIWKGFCIIMLGSVAQHAGLQSLHPKVTPAGNDAADRVTLPKLVLLWIVGAVLILAPLPLGSLGGSFFLSCNAALLAFALMPARSLGLSDNAHTSILLVATVLTVVVNIPLQSKLYPMLACMPMFMHLGQRTALRKFVLPGALFGILFYLTVWGPIVNPSRSIRYGTSLEKMRESFRQNSPLATGEFKLDLYRLQAENLLRRFAYAGDVAFEAREADTKGNMPSLFLDNVRWGFFPRILFPEKPWISRGAWFTTYMGFSRSEGEATCSTAMYVSGELYWSFGFGGVILGNYLLGLLASGLWRMAGTMPRKGLHALLYVNLLFQMGEVAEASSAFITLLIFYALFGLLLLPRFASRTSQLRFHRWSASQRFGGAAAGA